MNILVHAKDSIEEKNRINIVKSADLLRKIEITTENKNESVVIRISDTGLGLSQVAINTHSKRSLASDIGPGLTTAAEIIKKYNGNIEVVSQENIGTTVVVTIPVIPSVNVQLTSEAPSMQSSGSIVLEFASEESDVSSIEGSKKGTALIVDDEADIRSILKMYLEEFGIIVDEAANGLEALEIIKKDDKKYDFIVTDLKMPGLTGEQLIQEILMHDFTINHRPQILVITGGQETEYGTAPASIPGSDGYIKKPFDKGEIDLMIGLLTSNKLHS